ncbi:MAG: hypothetical protein QM703_26450 [Gemmatales bacterium]
MSQTWLTPVQGDVTQSTPQPETPMKIVSPLLAQGLPHQEVMKAALKQGANPKKVSNFLANVADAPRLQENRTGILVFQLCLLLLNLAFVADVFFNGFENLAPYNYALAGACLLFTAAFWYGISRNFASAYLAVIIMTASACVRVLPALKYTPEKTSLSLLLAVIVIAMAVRLKFRLFPQQNFFNTRKRADGGLCY